MAGQTLVNVQREHTQYGQELGMYNLKDPPIPSFSYSEDKTRLHIFLEVSGENSNTLCVPK